MKKLRTILILFLFLGLGFPVVYTAIELGLFSGSPKIEIKNSCTNPDAPTLHVVADYDFSPYSFYDDSGNVCGLDVELINEISNRLNMNVEIKFDKWQVCKKLLQDKEADVILGLEIFSHMNGVKKTIAVSDDQLLIFGKNKINNISALKGKKVGLMVNSVIEKIFDLNCEYKEYFTNTDILEALNSGEIDYGICHGSVGKRILEEKKYSEIIPSITLMQSYPAIGVREDLPELRDKINDIIVQIGSEGLINKLDEKWLVDFVSRQTFNEFFHRTSKFFAIYSTLFMLALIFILFVYRDTYLRNKAYQKDLEYNASLKRKNDLINSAARVYDDMISINITANTLEIISRYENEKIYQVSENNALEHIRNIVESEVISEDVEMAVNFTNLSTLPQRMMGKDIILAEFRGKTIGWFCAQFIAVEHDDNGNVTEVILTRQDINEMKKEKERLLQLSSFDELTMLYNRHFYKDKIQELKNNNVSNIKFIVFDINELKSTNDNIGHAAGDELILAAASCIKKSFESIGTCYRTGGDEFVVIIEKETEDFDSIVKDFNEAVNNWHGTLVKKMSISYGIASASEVEDFSADKYEELMTLADKRMYANKAEFYKTSGIERRR